MAQLEAINKHLRNIFPQELSAKIIQNVLIRMTLSTKHSQQTKAVLLTSVLSSSSANTLSKSNAEFLKILKNILQKKILSMLIN